MHRLVLLLCLAATGLSACSQTRGTDPPPEGWANRAPIVVERVVNRGDVQLLAIKQGNLQTWVQVPQVHAIAGDYVLLGQGTARHQVEIPEIGERVETLVDITHVQVTDQQTAQRVSTALRPQGAVEIATIYAELASRADQPIVVYGTVAKSTPAVGSIWVHLQDGTGDPGAKTHDLTVKTQNQVVEGQRVGFRGVLRKDVDIGFGYEYRALVEDAELLK